MQEKKIFMLMLLYFSLAFSLWSQTKTITGKVTSAADNEAIIGAAVVIQGMNSGTITDVDGNFTIQAKPTDILSVSFLGYAGQQVAIGERTHIDIKLAEEAQSLNELVVVGYGTQKKINLTGSVATVNFDEKLGGRTVMNASAALAGLSPGLQVMQTSSKPGDDGATLRIRGTTTINNSNPLVLVDGFEADMNNVNTHDIASISILKDASATAIYGSRAANGVVLVTTKRGEGKARVIFNHFTSFLEPLSPDRLAFVSDYADHMTYINEGRANTNKTPIFSEANILAWTAAKADPNGLNEYGVPNYMAYPNTDWYHELFNTGMAHEYNLSVQGASENVSYLMSGGYLTNEGVMKNTGLKKFQFRTNLEVKVTKWWTLGTRIFALKQEKGIENLTNAFQYIYQTTPGIYPGSYDKWGTPALTSEESSNANNVFAQMSREGYDKMFRGNATFYSNFRLYEGLHFEMSYNYAPDWGDYATWSAKIGTWDYVQNKRRNESDLDNRSITNKSFKRARYTADLLLRYNSNFSSDHELGAIVGYNQTYYNENEFGASKKGRTDWDLYVLDTGVNMTSINGTETDWSLRSVFGRINYAYKSKYLLEANMRYDQSSRFGIGKRGGYFPSFSAGWRMMEENFMQGIAGVVDNLKIRASWGQLGNNQLGNYDWQAGYSKANVVIDGSPSTALVMNKYSNPELHWESVTTSDIGLDIDLFKNRLSVEFDYYQKYTSGMILTPNNYLTAGTIAPASQNAAELKNQGIELSLKWRDNIGDFQYEIGGNLSYNTNKVTKFRGALEKGWVTDDNGNRTFVNNIGDVSRSGFGGLIMEGHTLGESYLRSLYKGNGTYSGSGELDINAGPVDGMIRTENDLKWVQAMQAAGYKFSPSNVLAPTSLYYGDLIYADNNEDGTYGDANDQKLTGKSSIPKYNFGLHLAASYKGFDLSMFWAGSAGFVLYWKQYGYNSPMIRNGFSVPKHYAENAYRWDPNDPEAAGNNQNGKFPRLLDETEGVNGAASEFWEYDASYIKLKNLQLGYTLPQHITQKIFMNKVRIYVTGENLLTFTKYPGMDPEAGANVTYPLTRQYAVGLNIVF